MKQRKSNRPTAASVKRWTRRLMARMQSVLAANPQADADNVRHTLILLEQLPLERLQKSLIRGRHTTICRK
jgi:predicted trehalose synthase